MRRLEVSCSVRHIYTSLGVKGLSLLASRNGTLFEKLSATEEISCFIALDGPLQC